ELTTNGSGQMGFNTDATDWTSTNGYNFIYAPGTADTTGATGVGGPVRLWGPNDGSANGLPATSPAGGNFVAADGNYQVAAISQTIYGLTTGDGYTVSFWWAGAQAYGGAFTSPTTDQWQVSFGSQTQYTSVVNNAGEGFTGWMQETMHFTADNTSDVLSFLAVGTPTGAPPFSLLDGVSVTGKGGGTTGVAPLPTAMSLSTVGLIGLAALRMRKGAKSASI
ncbi:MAG TPA: hypothetical protein VG722_10985, partial [Tepidisphaeraceae bacterium]|nr:hypothetical protein [Tepidisphaeraceae bacterium]